MQSRALGLYLLLISISVFATDMTPLKLEKSVNMGFSDEIAGDSKGGWFDQGPDNDLQKFPIKRNKFGSIPFQIIDPERNQGKSCLILRGKHTPFGKKEVVIPVKRYCSGFALLNACGWAKAEETAVRVIAVFSNGKEESFSLIPGHNTGDWWNPSEVPEAEIVWSKESSCGIVGIYCTEWDLQNPGYVKELRISSDMPQTTVGIIGITAIGKKMESLAEALSFTLNVPEKAKVAAFPFPVLKGQMVRQKIDSQKFLDRRKSAGKLFVLAPDGRKIPCNVVVFKRDFPPVLLLKTDGVTGNFKLKIGNHRKSGLIINPQKARKVFFPGKEFSSEKECGPGFLFTPEDFSGTALRIVPWEDSFFLHGLMFGKQNSFAKVTFNVPKDGEFNLHTYSGGTGAFANQWRICIDTLPEIVCGGGTGLINSNYPYWQGMEKIFLKKGNHTLVIVPRPKDEIRRSTLFLGFICLNPERKTPPPMTFLSELNAIKKFGAWIGGEEKWTDISDGAKKKKHSYSRRIAGEYAFPDLSYNIQGKAGENGFLQTRNGTFVFENGTALPSIWGCNMNYTNIYHLTSDKRLGKSGLGYLLDNLKSQGYEALRFMVEFYLRSPGNNQDNIPGGMLNLNPLEIAPEYMEAFWRLIAGCHERGMYLNVSLWHRNSVFGDICGDFNHKNPYVGFFHPEARKRLKRFYDLLLRTPNPYRNGLPPCKDPTILIIELENERNFVPSYRRKGNSWKELPVEARQVLYRLWSDFLAEKYGSFTALEKNWGTVFLQEGKTEKTFAAVDFVPVWDVGKWQNGAETFQVKLDDLRVSSSGFGKNKISNPAISDSLEFMYVLYRNYLIEMKQHLRDMGFRGIVTASSPDTEIHYSQRYALSEIGDAVTGGTGYWNRSGEGFLRSLDWLAPLVYFTNSGKPVIAREYGPNLIYQNIFWGSVITTVIQKAKGNAYLFNFSFNAPDPKTPDWLYPSDDFDFAKRCKVFLNQNQHIYSTMANLASSIALRSKGYRYPKFKLDIAVPEENVFYGAPFRGWNHLTFNNYSPFLYMPTFIHTFRGTYNGKADLVVNEPSLPSGNYSTVRNLFLIRPHSQNNRYGQKETQWFKGKRFAAEGFLDQKVELRAFYDAVTKAGYKMPIPFADMGKVWKDYSGKIELNTRRAVFLTDFKDMGIFIGNLKQGKEQTPSRFLAVGGNAWIFSADYGSNHEKSLLMAVMNGKINLRTSRPMDYVFFGAEYFKLERNGKPLLIMNASDRVCAALKTKLGKDIATAEKLFISVFPTRSASTPFQLILPGGGISAVYACNRDGERIAKIHHTADRFCNIWNKANQFSYYEVLRNF